MPENRRRNGRNRRSWPRLDSVNLRLLAELQADARLSLAELGRRVGLSSPAVAERMARLEQEGVIRGYHAELDPRALGLRSARSSASAPRHARCSQVGDLAQRTPEVVDCRRITGEDCYIMTAHVRSVEHLEEVIDRFTAYGQTTTSIVQSAPVASRGVALEVLEAP